MRYKLTLSYNGGSFCGWQIQNNAGTIQQKLQNALSLLLHEQIAVTGTGRTDSGVNATFYVAHFDCSCELLDNSKSFTYKINAILGKYITIHKVEQVSPAFHSRFDANFRQYKYFLHKNKDPFIEQFSFFYPHETNIAIMNECAELLVGEHDFRCFEKKGSDNTNSLCTVYDAKWESYIPSHVSIANFPAKENDYLVFSISANRFLRNMVRAVTGSLLSVGKGKKDKEWFASLMRDGSRKNASDSVPGHALFLTDVRYENPKK